MKRQRRDYLIPAEDDGLVVAEVGPWGTEKYRRLGMYAEMFSTGMKNRWDTRTYIDLFSGCGHALLKPQRLRVLTSPLIALTVPDPFDNYIFCDRDPHLLDALRTRVQRNSPTSHVEYVLGDANDRASEIGGKVPAFSSSHKVLSFCFVDPFGLDIHFDTIRGLGSARAMDFLILLALGMDATRNWERYVKPENNKVERFLGDVEWRGRWNAAERKGFSPIQFLATEYAAAMAQIGYLTTSLDQMIEVRTYENNMRLYYLAFFSKSKKGYDFWQQVQKYSTDQLGFGL
jgi:three-Cys-motif partner protein